VVALDGVTVAFPRGQFTAIMGPSGSGKSTLMHCLAGLDTASDGRVFIGETDLTALNDKRLTQLRRDAVGFVFQAYNLLPTLTALENITLPMDLAGRTPDRQWLDTVNDTVGLRDRLSHRPTELSGGQQQRVAIARSLVNDPVVILADEPTGALDSRTGEEIMGIFQRLNREGKTVVLVTHEWDIAMHCKRIIRFKDGKVLSDESVREPKDAMQELARMPDIIDEEVPV